LLWLILGNNGDSLQSTTTVENKTIPTVATHLSKATDFVQELTLSGVTQNRRTINITAQTKGLIESVLAHEGTLVFAGETIVTLKVEDKLENFEKAQAQLKQRQLEYHAAKSLAKSGHRAETALAQSYYLFKEAQASLRAAELDVEYLHVKSPFTGLLNRIHFHEGSAVTPLDTVIATLIDFDPLLVVGYAPERLRSAIAENSFASVTLTDATEVEGIIHYISHSAEENTRTYRVDIAIPNPQGLIHAGSSAEIKIPLQKIQAHFIPSSALSLSDEGVLQVKYADEQNIVHAATIKIEGDNAKGLWVTGLPETANIITFGQAYVREGDSVTTKQEQPAP
jgi:multidrug efflux system membrane fusion protein